MPDSRLQSLGRFLRLSLHSLAYFFLLACVFLGCQLLYKATRQWIWPLAPDLSLQFLWLDRLAYALSFGLLGSLLLLFTLPRLLRHPPASRPSPAWQTVWLIGISSGLVMFLLIWLSQAGQPEATGLHHQRMQVLMQEPGYTLQTWLATGLLTPTLEEVFYRAGMCSFLIGSGLVEQWNRYLLPDHSVDQIGPAHLLLLIPAVAFALVHRQYHLLFLLWGIVFTLLYLRYGLLAAIVSHSTYNSLLIGATYLHASTA